MLNVLITILIVVSIGVFLHQLYIQYQLKAESLFISSINESVIRMYGINNKTIDPLEGEEQFETMNLFELERAIADLYEEGGFISQASIHRRKAKRYADQLFNKNYNSNADSCFTGVAKGINGEELVWGKDQTLLDKARLKSKIEAEKRLQKEKIEELQEEYEEKEINHSPIAAS